MAERHLSYLQPEDENPLKRNSPTKKKQPQPQEQCIQLNQLDQTQQKLIFEKFWLLESNIMKSYSTRPGSPQYALIEKEFYKFVMQELENKDSEIYQNHIVSGQDSQMFCKDQKFESQVSGIFLSLQSNSLLQSNSIINRSSNQTSNLLGSEMSLRSQDEQFTKLMQQQNKNLKLGIQAAHSQKEQTTSKLNQFTKLTKLEMNKNTKKQSSRYSNSDDSSQIIDQYTSTNLLKSMYKQKFEGVSQDEQEQSPKIRPKQGLQQGEDANDFFKSYEQFLEKMDESGYQDLIQAERSRQRQKCSTLISQKNILPVINEIFEGPGNQQEIRGSKVFYTQTDQKVKIVEMEEISSVGSKAVNYQNLKILDFAEAWNQARLHSKNRNQIIQQPYFSKKKKEKSCCAFFRKNEKSLSQDLQREKSLVLEMKETPFDIEKEFHRNLLYTIQVFFVHTETFIFDSSIWLRLGFTNNDPSIDLVETGIFGLVQILYVINHFQVMIRSYFDIQKEFTKFRLCFFMIQLSKVVLDLLLQDRLDPLILKFNSCINCLDLLLATIMFNVVEICRVDKKFDQNRIQTMLEALQNKSNDKIQQLVLKFPQQAVEYQKNC